MRRRTATAACLAIAITWLALVCTAHATGDVKDRVSKLLADADLTSAEALVAAELKRVTPESTETAYWYNENGIIAQARGHYAEARDWFARALRIRLRLLGARHSDATTSLNNVALMEEQTGHYTEALAHFLQAWRTNAAELGPHHRKTLTTLSNMGLLNLTLGHIETARSQLQRALDATAITEGWWADNTATSLTNLASLYITEFRFDEATKLLLRALAIDEYRHSPSHPDVAITLNNLGELYRLQGRPVEAEQSFLRAASIDKAILGTGSTAYAIDMLNLATLYRDTDRLGDSRASLDNALQVIASRRTGHAEATAAALSELAHLLCRQGQCSKAKDLLQAAATALSTSRGPHDAASLQLLDDLADLHATMGDHAAAARSREQYLTGTEVMFGPQSPVVVRARVTCAGALAVAGRLTDARRMIKGLQPLIERHFGRRSIDAARLMDVQARLSLDEGKLRDALRHARRSMQLYRLWLSPNAPQLAQLNDLMARIHLRQGRWRQAVQSGQRALRIISDRRQRAADGGEDTILRRTMAMAIEATRHIRNDTTPITTAIKVAEVLADDRRNDAVAIGALKREAMRTGSLSLLHRRDLLRASLEDLDATTMTSSSSVTAVLSLQKRRQSIRFELDAVQEQLTRRLAQRADLLDHRRPDPGEIQRHLRDGEMLLYLLPDRDTVTVLAMTRDARVGHTVGMSRAELSGIVTRLRAGLDPVQWKNSFEPFDRATAFRLYAQLFKPIEPMLRASRTLFVVTGAPLDELPLAVLVDAPPPGGTAGDSSPDALRATSWLGRRFGIIQLPSASALWQLRRPTEETLSPRSFLGIGTQQISMKSQGAMLPPLTATEPELQALARTIGATQGTLLMGASATKAAFTRARPDRKSVIAFATHALTARQSGIGEPALALSAPASRKPADSLLRASDIEAMDLSADWVILSGCNTAGDGAQGAATLAEAFMLAGARSLLVSHWPVADRAAASMTTAVVGNFRARPREGQADALRRAMIETMEDRSHPLNAHPSTWAAFSLIGEARRADRLD